MSSSDVEAGEYTITLTVTDNDDPCCCDSADPNCEAQKLFNDPDTPLDEAEQRAYEVQYEFDHPISVALPGGCTP